MTAVFGLVANPPAVEGYLEVSVRDNIGSLAAHGRLGFEVTGRLITFRKSLDR